MSSGVDGAVGVTATTGDVFAASAPLLFLVALMLAPSVGPLRPLAAHVALPLAAVAAVAARTVHFGALAGEIVAATTAGALAAGAPLAVVAGAALLGRAALAPAREALRRAAKRHVRGGAVAHALAGAWALGALIEGVAGFGTPGSS